MIHKLYQKQVEAWKERFSRGGGGSAEQICMTLKNYDKRDADLLSSRHKDTIELLEAEIERKKKMRKEYEHFEKETPYYSVNENMRRHESYNKCLDQDIAYLEEQLKLIKKEI